MSAPRVATANAFYRQPTTFKRAIFFNGLQTILGAGWGVTTTGRHVWRYGPLPKADDGDKKGAYNFAYHGFTIFFMQAVTALAVSANSGSFLPL